jgi:hypothetical protein
MSGSKPARSARIREVEEENTTMKKVGFLALGAALALPLAAQGKVPLPNGAFGTIEANLDVCSEVDSKSAARYQEAKKKLTQGATEEEIKAARDSQEYRDAYSETKQELEKEPQAEVIKSCAAVPDQSN